MSLEENKAIVRGYMEEVLNKGNMSAFDDYFAEDVVFNGRKNLRQFIASNYDRLRKVFPDLHLTIEAQVAEADKVATRVTFHGTHQGEYMGISPTGKQIAYSGIAIDRIADGKIVEMWHEADSLEMLRQLGVKIG